MASVVNYTNRICPIGLAGRSGHSQRQRPPAGVIVDRFDRRHIMIGADLLRGAAVLGLLFVRTPETVWLAYVVTGLSLADARAVAKRNRPGATRG